MNEADVVETLMDGDEEFKKLFEEHKELDKKVNDLQESHSFSPEDELEIKRLKKMKLSLKDRIERKKREFLVNN